MCMYACVFLCVCVFVRAYVHVCMCVRICICVCVSVCACMCVLVCGCVCSCSLSCCSRSSCALSQLVCCGLMLSLLGFSQLSSYPHVLSAQVVLTLTACALTVRALTVLAFFHSCSARDFSQLVLTPRVLSQLY